MDIDGDSIDMNQKPFEWFLCKFLNETYYEIMISNMAWKRRKIKSLVFSRISRLVLCFSLVHGSHSYIGSVIQVISGWICVESVFQVIFDLQGVAMSNLLLDMVCIE